MSAVQAPEVVFENSNELVVEIRHGEGGKDSKLFVQDLLSAYLHYASSLGLKTEIISSEVGHVVLKVIGKNAWNAFKHESGKHIVQRIPPTERNDRKHTSLVCVAVLSLPPESKQILLEEKDLEIIRQTGKQKAGGQHSNKTMSAVRMKHKPTGLSVFINGRKQHQNHKEALRILTAKVNNFFKERNKIIENEKRSLQNGDVSEIGKRGNKIRSYNFMENRIVDHVLGKKTNNVKEFMKGNFYVLFQTGDNDYGKE